MSTPYDMIIIGAGLSGIGAACRYKMAFPDKVFAILEMRSDLGGTWDLFQYPGVRSDSDMLTLGYDFNPWDGDEFLASGKNIKDYIAKTATDFDIKKHIQFSTKVVSANFDTNDNFWTLTIQRGADVSQVKTRFILSCAGYYNYEQGHSPVFKNQGRFKGDIIHPQFWPEGYDHSNKNIVVVGSGATAVTLVPELAKTACHVTMLQRSPSYVLSLPSIDYVGNVVRFILPKKWAHRLNRRKNIELSRFMYQQAKNNPSRVKRTLRRKIQKVLGKDYPVDVHFNPRYNPWEQRLCIVPDNDLFSAIKEGKASIITDEVDHFTNMGVVLKSGQGLGADLIVTATGLNVVFAGNIAVTVEDHKVDLKNTFGYKGMMFSDVPNFISVFGYTNASWTLRADLISRYMVRLLDYMEIESLECVTPSAPEHMTARPWVDFEAGYLKRVMDDLPKQGDHAPWLNPQDYKYDLKSLLEAPIDDEALTFV